MAKDLKVNITGDGRKLDSELTRTASEIAKVERQAKQAQKEINNLNKSTNSLKGGITDLANGIKNLDFASINNGISAIGENASSVLPNIGKLAKVLFNPYVLAGTAIIGAGKALYDYNVELEKSLRRTEQFTSLSGDALMSLRNGIKSVADTFGKDYNDVLSTVDGLMCQFGIDGESALNIIRDGFVGGCDDGGKLFDLIGRFGGVFKDAGISASELVAIIGNTRSGIFNEEGMELIAMGATKIREFSTSLQESLKAVGIDADEMYSKLQNGEITTIQALQSISSKLKELPPQTNAVGNVLKDVFGKKGAKAGYELVTALADVETDLEKVKEQTGEWGKSLENLQEANRNLEDAMSDLFGIADGGLDTLSNKLKTALYDALTWCINATIDLWNAMVDFNTQCIRFEQEIVKLWNVCVGFCQGACEAFQQLGEVIEGVFTLNWDKVKAGWKEGLNSIKSAINKAIEDTDAETKVRVELSESAKIDRMQRNTSSNTTTKTNNNFTNTNSSNTTTNKNKTTNKKEEVVKTKIELDRESLEKTNKEVKQAMEDFNNGLITRVELDSVIDKANSYFKDNGIKANVEVEYSDDEYGFEKVAIKKPVKIQTELEVRREQFKEVQTTIRQLQDDFNNKLVDAEYADSQIEEINIKLKELGVEPITLKVDANGVGEILDDTTKRLKELEEAQKKAEEASRMNQQTFQALGSTFTNLGSAMGGMSGRFMEYAGQSINAISQMIPQILSLIGAKEGEAIASATAEGAKLQFPASIAAIASMIATITSIFASIPKFADGGVIGGTSTVGDFNIARVNKGEMILNGRQQAKLFNMLSTSGYYSSDNVKSGNVTFKIHGKDLIGTINNYNKKVNKAL